MGRTAPRRRRDAYAAWLIEHQEADAKLEAAGFALGGAGLFGQGDCRPPPTKRAQSQALEQSILTDLARFEALAGPAATADFLRFVATIFDARVKDHPNRGRPKGTSPYANGDRKVIAFVESVVSREPDIKPTTLLREMSYLLARKDDTGASSEAILQRLKVAWRESRGARPKRQEE